MTGGVLGLSRQGFRQWLAGPVCVGLVVAVVLAITIVNLVRVLRGTVVGSR